MGNLRGDFTGLNHLAQDFDDFFQRGFAAFLACTCFRGGFSATFRRHGGCVHLRGGRLGTLIVGRLQDFTEFAFTILRHLEGVDLGHAGHLGAFRVTGGLPHLLRLVGAALQIGLLFLSSHVGFLSGLFHHAGSLDDIARSFSAEGFLQLGLGEIAAVFGSEDHASQLGQVGRIELGSSGILLQIGIGLVALGLTGHDGSGLGLNSALVGGILTVQFLAGFSGCNWGLGFISLLEESTDLRNGIRDLHLNRGGFLPLYGAAHGRRC